MSEFDSIGKAIAAIKRGDMVIVADDEKRENEGDLVMAAEHVTAEKMAFIIRHTGGVVCLSLNEKIADRLDLPPMVQSNSLKYGTAFTVSIDAANGITTGISAQDRVQTIRSAIRGSAKPADLLHPGHVFPLRANPYGVFLRAGHTEASVDLCRLAGCKPAAVLSELMHDDGTLRRLPELKKFARKHRLLMISIADLIHYRRQHDQLITRTADAKLETNTGSWQIRIYKDVLHQLEQVVLVKVGINHKKLPLVRLHSACFTGDTLGSEFCDCGPQLKSAMEKIAAEESGVVLYLAQEGRGIGLTNKIRAYDLQQKKGLDTVEANEQLGFPSDIRDYAVGAQILRDLGLKKIRLLTNNPLKVSGLRDYGIEVVEQVPLEISATNKYTKRYLQTKKKKLGHLLRNV